MQVRYVVVGKSETGNLKIPKAPPGSYAQLFITTGLTGGVRIYYGSALVTYANYGGTACNP